MPKIGFFKDSEEDEEEIYIPSSFVICPVCEDKVRSDEFPREEYKTINCTCKNLTLGFKNGSDKVSARRGGQVGFLTVRYKDEYPLFI